MQSSSDPLPSPSLSTPPRVEMSRRGSRRDGEASRERILRVAMQLFATQGFKNTSTRDIAKAAQVNIAALNYYFGDKAGLYRTAFAYTSGPHNAQTGMQQGTEGFSRPGIPLGQAMHELFSEFLQPLARGEEFLWGMRMRLREFLEPTGMWQEEIDKGIKPVHAAVRRVVCRELDRLHPDTDIERLSACIIGMAVHLIVGHDVLTHVYPHLLSDQASVQVMADRMATYACDLILAEARRRENQA